MNAPHFNLPMKIAKAESTAIAIPFSHGAERAGFKGQDWSRIFMVLIRLETSDGLVGWGDAFGYSCWNSVKPAFDHCVAPLVKDRVVENIPAFMRNTAQILHTFGQNGVMQYALSGLDIALWDLKAKSLGCPLRDVIGPARRDHVPGYSSLFKYDDAEMVRQKCRESLDEGFGSIKLHEITYDNIAVAREVCGDGFDIMVDVNCPWTEEEAVAAACSFRPLDLLWLEEPVYPPDDFAALARIEAKSGIRIGAGENACGLDEFRRMIDVGSVRYIQPSVTKVGGVSACLAIRNLCAEKGAVLRPHSPYYGPGFLATVQLAAANPEEIPVEWFKLDLEASLFGDLLHPKQGRFTVGSGDGLGCDPDPDIIREYSLTLRS